MGQPLLVAGALNADPGIIHCLVKGIASGRFIDLALAHSIGSGKEPEATCIEGFYGCLSQCVGCIGCLPGGVEDSSVGGRCRMPFPSPTHPACLLGGHSGLVFLLLL